MADVYEHTGDNPPGLDVLSKHDVVLWKHPQHGWLKAEKNGGFTPMSEADATRLKGPVPSPTPGATPETAGALTAPIGSTGAGSSTVNKAALGRGNPLTGESARARAEGEHQATMDRAKFAAPERADPMAGLGLVERSEVDRLVRGGMKPEEAVAQVKRKSRPAAAQAEALKQ